MNKCEEEQPAGLELPDYTAVSCPCRKEITPIRRGKEIAAIKRGKEIAHIKRERENSYRKGKI